MKKRTMNVNIPVTDEQIERLEKLLPKVRDEIIKRYKEIFDEDTWDQLGPMYADVFEYIADKESNSFVVGILVNILMEVVDDERFYDAFDWEPEAGGFEPQKKVASGTAKAGAHKINVLVACGQTCKTVPKISSIYYFEPGAHTEGDGYLYQNRSLSDVFVFPNGKDNKVDSVFVDVDTAEFGA